MVYFLYHKQQEYGDHRRVVTDGDRALRDAIEAWKKQKHMVEDRREACPLKDRFPPEPERPKIIPLEEMDVKDMNMYQRRAWFKIKLAERKKGWKQEKKILKKMRKRESANEQAAPVCVEEGNEEDEEGEGDDDDDMDEEDNVE